MDAMSLSAEGCGEQRPGVIEAFALGPTTKIENCLASLVSPAHPTLLESLGDQRLAGGFHHPSTDGQSLGLHLGVAHALPALAEVGELGCDTRVAGMLLTKVCQRPNHRRDAVGFFQEDVPEFRKATPGFDRAGMVADERFSVNRLQLEQLP
jgi:hypothetical protein